MPPVIDHTAFPHILDVIWSHASRGTLISLRAASREWQERADRILFRHVLVRDDEGVTELIVESPFGERLPLIEMIPVIEKTTAYTPNRRRIASMAHCTLSPVRPLWYTVCLDVAIVRHRVTPATMLEVCTAFPHVRIILTKQDNYGHIRLPLPAISRATILTHVIFQSMGRILSEGFNPPIPQKEAKKCIVSLGDRMDSLSRIIPRTTALDEVYLVFCTSELHTPDGFQVRDRLKALVHSHKCALEKGKPGAAYTIVGLFQLLPSVHGFGEGTASEMATSFFEWLQGEARKLALSTLPHVVFQSREEYREMVGEEAWGMATQPCRGPRFIGGEPILCNRTGLLVRHL